MPDQLTLRYNDSYRDAEQADELMDLVREVVAALGLKQVAYDLDVQPSALAHALAERDRHYPRLRWLPYLVRHAPSDSLAALVAGWRGLECRPLVQLTPAEQLERLRVATRELLGPELVTALEKKAGLV